MKLPKHVLQMTWQDYAAMHRPAPGVQPSQPAKTNKAPAHYLQPVSFSQGWYDSRAASVRARLQREADFQAMVDEDPSYWSSPDDS